jgi:hypothetical protein
MSLRTGNTLLLTKPSCPGLTEFSEVVTKIGSQKLASGQSNQESPDVGGISDRKQEIKRRRHRRKKIEHFKRRLKKATTSEKGVIAEKLRKMTPGAEQVIEQLGVQAR